MYFISYKHIVCGESDDLTLGNDLLDVFESYELTVGWVHDDAFEFDYFCVVVKSVAVGLWS